MHLRFGMLIVWGKKIVRRNQGYIGDFCPICRRVQVFRAAHVRSVPHLYYIPTGLGKHLVDEITCQHCGLMMGLAPGATKSEPEKPDESAQLMALAERTSPTGTSALRRRLAIEARVTARAGLTASERLSLMAEPIAVISYMHDKRAEAGTQTSITAVLTVLLLAALVATALLWNEVRAPGRPSAVLLAWALGVTVLTAGLLAGVVYRVVTDRRRAANSYIVVPLANSLRHLGPTHEELRTTVDEFKAQKARIALDLDLNELMLQIDTGGRDDRFNAPAATRGT